MSLSVDEMSIKRKGQITAQYTSTIEKAQVFSQLWLEYLQQVSLY